MEIAFVILNYGTYKETVECVSSIFEHIDTNDYMITIIDNGSIDDSLSKLQEKYLDNVKVDIIPTNENLGFAKGNNIGIKYVNNKYSPEFVIVLNSDIELFQDNIYAKISTEFKKSHFGVWGPMMLTGTARCDDSPWVPMTLSQAQIQLEKSEKTYKLLKYMPFALFRIQNKVFSSWKKEKDERHQHGEFWKYQTDVELQGAFLVFSKPVFEHIEGFDNRTFLYYEEQLLYMAVKKAGMKMVYDPRYAVYHKDGISTKKGKSTKKKMLFLQKCTIESLHIVISEMRKEGEKSDYRFNGLLD